MTIELLLIGFAFICGIALGLFFLGCLWWTVQRLPRTRSPRSFYFATLIVRMSVILAGFAGLASSGDWRMVAAGTFGFVLTRTVGVRLSAMQPPEGLRPESSQAGRTV